MYEYLPAFLGKEVPEFDGYKPDVHPGISHVFQSAAFRLVLLLGLHVCRYPINVKTADQADFFVATHISPEKFKSGKFCLEKWEFFYVSNHIIFCKQKNEQNSKFYNCVEKCPHENKDLNAQIFAIKRREAPFSTFV